MSVAGIGSKGQPSKDLPGFMAAKANQQGPDMAQVEVVPSRPPEVMSNIISSTDYLDPRSESGLYHPHYQTLTALSLASKSMHQTTASFLYQAYESNLVS